MSNESIQKVRERLTEWGEWSRHGAIANLGYPTRAAHLSIRSDAHNDIYIQSQRITETDRAMLQLRGAHPAMYAVLNQEYYWQCTIAGGAARLNISPATYKNRRSMAEYWMDSRLNYSMPQKKCLTG